MTGGIYTPAWWRAYVEPLAEPYLVERVETVLDGVRGSMTAAEIVEAERLIDVQRQRLSMGPRNRRTG